MMTHENRRTTLDTNVMRTHERHHDSRYMDSRSSGSRSTPRKTVESSYGRDWESNNGYEPSNDSWAPQFCMTCEKEFSSDGRELYCSEICRNSDFVSPASIPTPTSYSRHPSYTASAGRDVVPRASPSRPTPSNYFSSPPITPLEPVSHSHHDPNSPYYPRRHSAAVAALRNISINPPSPNSPHAPASASGGFWPFGGRAAQSPQSATRPSPSLFPATYDVSDRYQSRR